MEDSLSREIRSVEENVILVNEYNQEIGTAEKIEAHRKGLLHRAFSIFVLNSKGLLLLQRRAFSKYHSGGLWANTCCSHPRPGELTEAAAQRRLVEEMGFDCKLAEILSFIYRVRLDNNLIEYEYDHVFTGKYNGMPTPNNLEVYDWKWLSIDDLIMNIQQKPYEYAFWLRASIDKVASILKRH
jgi:isopentenyl-diphosphate delta-isomerase